MVTGIHPGMHEALLLHEGEKKIYTYEYFKEELKEFNKVIMSRDIPMDQKERALRGLSVAYTKVMLSDISHRDALYHDMVKALDDMSLIRLSEVT